MFSDKWPCWARIIVKISLVHEWPFYIIKAVICSRFALVTSTTNKSIFAPLALVQKSQRKLLTIRISIFRINNQGIEESRTM